MDISIIQFNPPWISPIIWKEMVDFWLTNVTWKKKSSVGKINRNSKADFMVYRGGAKSIASHKEAMVRMPLNFHLNFYLMNTYF